MKLVLAIEYPSLKPLAFFVFHMFVLDKGFYAYKHYTDGLLKYDIIPLIFPRKNFKIEKGVE
jgi:hypothetical protein